MGPKGKTQEERQRRLWLLQGGLRLLNCLHHWGVRGRECLLQIKFLFLFLLLPPLLSPSSLSPFLSSLLPPSILEDLVRARFSAGWGFNMGPAITLGLRLS